MKRKLLIGSIACAIIVIAIIVISVLAINGGKKSPEAIAKNFPEAIKSEKAMNKYLNKYFDFKLSCAIDMAYDDDDFYHERKNYDDAVKDALKNIDKNKVKEYENDIRDVIKDYYDEDEDFKFQSLGEEKDFPGNKDIRYRVAKYLDSDGEEEYVSFAFYKKKLVLILKGNLDEFYDEYATTEEFDN